MEEALACVCDGHFGVQAMHLKLLCRGSYYWPKMRDDFCLFVNCCAVCQKRRNLIHAPSHELVPIESPQPFSIWGLDLIGIISPPSFDGYKLIITVTSYFMKLAEAVSGYSQVEDREINASPPHTSSYTVATDVERTTGASTAGRLYTHFTTWLNRKVFNIQGFFRFIYNIMVIMEIMGRVMQPSQALTKLDIIYLYIYILFLREQPHIP